MAASKSENVKWPPPLNNDESYETWKKDIEIWAKLTDLKKPKQALAIHLSLTGKARIASSELSVESLNSDSGVELILEKLDALFLLDKGRRQFAAFKNLYDLKREGKSILEHISSFEHTYYRFKQEGMSLPDPVMAFMLIVSCGFDDNEMKLVMSAIGEISYENAKITLKRIFSKDISKPSEGAECKGDVFYGASGGTEIDSDRGNEVYWSSRGYRGRPMRGVYTRAIRWSRGNPWNRSARGGQNEGNSGKMQLNPIGREGQVTRCTICESKYHWVKFCPDSYEAIEAKKPDEGKKSEDNDEGNLSMFVAYIIVAYMIYGQQWQLQENYEHVGE